MLNREHAMLLLRDVRLAVVHCTVWLLLLWVSSHPLEEWAVTAVVLYLALWLSREIVASLTGFAAGRLVDYGRRTLQKAGIEPPDSPPAEYKHIITVLTAVVAILTLTAIVGASLSVGVPSVAWLGLTPLAPYFNWIGWALLTIGIIGVSFYFAVGWLAFVTLDNLLDGQKESSGKGVIGLYAITAKAAAPKAILP